MNPDLLKALREMLAKDARLQAQGITPTDEQRADWLARKTGDPAAWDKARNYLGSIDGGMTLRNIGRSLGQGATYGFGDELAGMAGGEGAKEDMRLRGEVFHRQHPLIDAGLQGLGGIPTTALAAMALPEAALGAAGATTIGAAAGRGALAGAAAGGLAGIGGGEGLAGRAVGGATGAAFGAGVGGALGGVGAKLTELLSPAARAARRVGHAMDASGGLSALSDEAKRLTGLGRGDLITPADLSDPMRQELDYAANNSADVWTQARRLGRARQAGQAQRLLDDVGDFAGNSDAEARKTALDAGTRSWAAGPNGYGGIEDANPPIDVSPFVARLTKPTVMRQWQLARLAGDLTHDSPLDQLLQRLTGANPGASPEQIVAAGQRVAPGGDAPRPVTFADVQQLRRLLKGKAGEAYGRGNGALGAAYKQIQGEVDQSIAQSVPDAPRVNAVYAQRKDLTRAVEAGQAAWENDDTRALSRQVAAMSPIELTEFRTGLASKLYNGLSNTATNRDVAGRLVNASDGLQRKLELAFGTQQTFDDFMARVKAEAQLAEIRGTYGGSPTHRRGAAAAFDPAELEDEVLTHGVLHGATGGVSLIQSLLTKMGKGALQRRTAAAEGPMLLQQGSHAVDDFLHTVGAGHPLLGQTGGLYLPTMAGHDARGLLDY